MFDIGFFELLLIGVVALLVIGPDQLPAALRTLALWWGRLKRGLASTRSELEQHLGADDIRRQLHNEDILRQLRETKKDVENTLTTGKSGTDSTAEKAPTAARDDESGQGPSTPT